MGIEPTSEAWETMGQFPSDLRQRREANSQLIGSRFFSESECLALLLVGVLIGLPKNPKTSTLVSN
jgi:hypothetical protein